LGARAGLIVSIALLALSLSPLAAGDQPIGLMRIGVLNPQIGSNSMEEALRRGLSQHGYVEGKNIAVEWRRAAETPEQMQALATDLVNARVELIVALGSPATKAALSATTKPVVFFAGDPVGSGFATSLARPGGNGTGVSLVYTDLIVKLLEFLHEAAPRAKRVLYLINRSNPAFALALPRLEDAAKSLGLRILVLDAANTDELDVAINRISHGAGDAVLIGGDLLALANRHKIAEAIRKARLPAIVPFKQFQEAGVLMSYGPNYDVAMLQVADYIDRVLKGAKPAELPIEQVSKYELVVDLRLARELGLNMPQSILVRADEVIQ